MSLIKEGEKMGLESFWVEMPVTGKRNSNWGKYFSFPIKGIKKGAQWDQHSCLFSDQQEQHETESRKVQVGYWEKILHSDGSWALEHAPPGSGHSTKPHKNSRTVWTMLSGMWACGGIVGTIMYRTKSWTSLTPVGSFKLKISICLPKKMLMIPLAGYMLPKWRSETILKQT